jgi:hypothetical protein
MKILKNNYFKIKIKFNFFKNILETKKQLGAVKLDDYFSISLTLIVLSIPN